MTAFYKPAQGDSAAAVAEGYDRNFQQLEASKVDTADHAGLMTDTEREKLADIEEGANAYTLSPATTEMLGGVKIGAGLEVAEDGTLSATAGDETGGGVGQAYPGTTSGEIFNDYSSNKAEGDYSHAEGRGTIASGIYSHAEGQGSKAAGRFSHAEGYQGFSIGDYSHSEGQRTHANGDISHAEGYTTIASGYISHAEGEVTVASGYISHAEGAYSEAKGRYSHAGGFSTKADCYCQTAIGIYNIQESTPPLSYYSADKKAFSIGNGQSEGERSDAFRVFFNGNVEADGTYTSPAADYAELFEWADGNPNNEDRVGRFVVPEGSKIRLATPDDTYILGVVSGAPSVIGDNPLAWQGKYANDEWGRPIYEDVEVEYEDIENGEPVMKTRMDKVRKLNPDYNPKQTYTPRLKRPEWDAVGMVGKLLIQQDGSLKAGGFCTPGQEGLSTTSQTGYYVLEVINDTQAKIIVK